jgi:hypothetical protein
MGYKRLKESRVEIALNYGKVYTVTEKRKVRGMRWENRKEMR